MLPVSPIAPQSRAAVASEFEPLRRSARKAGGFALVQVMMAVGLVIMCGAAGTISLVQLNKKAVAMRTLNNARAVVQRNIDRALAVPFTRTLAPDMLAITTTSGADYDDDGGADNLVNIVTPRSTGAAVQGKLTRIVLVEAGADVRRVTFRLNYDLRGRAYSISMTTLRAMD